MVQYNNNGDSVTNPYTLRTRQDVHHFADNIFKCIFFNENIWILIKISLKFVPESLIGNMSVWIQVMAWRRTGDKPLLEPMMTQFNASLSLNEFNSQLQNVRHFVEVSYGMSIVEILEKI